MLGTESPFTWKEPSVADGSIAAALSMPRAQRALALLQTGERNRASQELRSLAAASEIDARIALLVIAERNGMPSVALRTAATLLAENGTPIERALYPVPMWKPRNGFAIDRALTEKKADKA